MLRNLIKLDAEHHGCLTADLKDKSKIPLVVDQMDDNFSSTFNAYPDRVVFVRDGKILYLGNKIMKQLGNPLHLMTHEARQWLEQNVGKPSPQ